MVTKMDLKYLEVFTVNKLKCSIIGTFLSLVTLCSNASVINVGGVLWDPDASSDWSGVVSMIHQDVDSITGELSGYGYIASMNNTPSATFCPGCELTFQYGGFLPTGGALLPSASTAIQYTGGYLNIFLDFSPEIIDYDYNTLTAFNTGDEGGANALWLSAEGFEYSGTTTFEGFVIGDFLELSGLGFWDVTGGLAAANIDTNTVLTENGYTDFKFTSSFAIDVTQLSADGTGNYEGDSISTEVPAPHMPLLFSMAILLTALRYRKS